MEKGYKTAMGADRILAWLIGWWKKNKCPFLSSMLIGLLAHGFAFTNKLLNQDELGSLFAKGATVDSGRWGIELVRLIMPDFSMPWIYGILSLLMISLAVCLIVELMQVENKVLQILLGGLILTHPSLTATITYMFTVSTYSLSYLLAVVSVCLICRKGKWNKAVAVVCLVLSLSMYQAYLAVAAALLVLYLIRRLLTQEAKARELFRQGIGFVIFLAVSAGIYWLIHMCLLRILSVEMNSYATGALTDKEHILLRLVYAYGIFVLSFVKGSHGLVPTPFGRILHIVCIAVILVELVVWLRKNRSREEKLLFLLLVALFPLAVNCMYLISGSAAIHTLVLYSHACVYVLAAVVLDVCGLPLPVEKLRRAGRNVAALCMSLVIVCNIYLANEVYLKIYMTYENTYSLCNTVLAQIQMTPGYTRDTEVVLMGNHKYAAFYENFTNLENVVGSGGVSLGIWSSPAMFSVYCGETIVLNNSDEIQQQIIATEEFQQMPCYPDNGSIRMIGDRVVVKWS